MTNPELEISKISPEHIYKQPHHTKVMVLSDSTMQVATESPCVQNWDTSRLSRHSSGNQTSVQQVKQYTSVCVCVCLQVSQHKIQSAMRVANVHNPRRAEAWGQVDAQTELMPAGFRLIFPHKSNSDSLLRRLLNAFVITTGESVALVMVCQISQSVKHFQSDICYPIGWQQEKTLHGVIANEATHVHTHVGRRGHTLAVSAVCAMRSSCFLVSDKTPKNPIFTSSDLCVCVSWQIGSVLGANQFFG